jgi:hypothetical protein
VLTIEHRAASSPEPLDLALLDQPALHLEVVASADTSAATDSLPSAVLRLLRESGPLSRDGIRRHLRVRNQRLSASLQMLSSSGAIEQAPEGWRVAGAPLSTPTVPVPTYRASKGTERSCSA